jgi:meiotic recombination protein REC8
MDLDDFQLNAGDDAEAFQDLGADVLEELISSETAEAPQRSRKKKTAVVWDDTQELRNNELARMNNEYAQNMQQAAAQRSVTKMAAQAKKNALFWVLVMGIGGIGKGIGINGAQHPLQVFSGDDLYSALVGHGTAETGRKRKSASEEGESTDREIMRKRSRDEIGDQVGPGDEMMQDDGFIPMDEDDIYVSYSRCLPPHTNSSQDEVGRRTSAMLADTSTMPWNATASIQGSRHGSSAPRKTIMGAVGGFPSSAGGASSLPGMDLPHRASRLTSASPLTGRSGPGLERFSSIDIPGSDALLGEHGLNQDDEVEVHGPAAAVDTQTAAQSQWMRAALDQESSNFLNFLLTEATDKGNVEGGVVSVTFEELIPVGTHSKVVAAQAFHHVLALASKGLIEVVQEEGYEEIRVDISVEA